MRLLAGVALVLALLATAATGHAAMAPRWKPIGPAPIRVPTRFQQGDGLGPNSGQITGIAMDVTSLVYDPATSVLLAGTYGRGRSS